MDEHYAVPESEMETNLFLLLKFVCVIWSKLLQRIHCFLGAMQHFFVVRVWIMQNSIPSHKNYSMC